MSSFVSEILSDAGLFIHCTLPINRLLPDCYLMDCLLVGELLLLRTQITQIKHNSELNINNYSFFLELLLHLRITNHNLKSIENEHPPLPL